MSDISELFARDPAQCTDSDIDLIIAEYRKKHALFKLGNEAPPKRAAKKPVSNVDLSDLGL